MSAPHARGEIEMKPNTSHNLRRGVTYKPTAISYLDYCVNPVFGCTPVSEGCSRCWAAAWAKQTGRDFSQVKTDVKKMLGLQYAKFGTDNLRRGAGSKPLVGMCFLSDLFHPAVPAEFIVSAFEVMSYRKDVDWIVLTKRPERMVSVLFGEEGNWYLGGGDFYDHILIGVTAENQARADERIPILLQNWAGPKWVSVEPQLEYVDLFAHISQLSWIVNGGESGPNRRPFNAQWAVNLYHQCLAANVRYFFKQGSATFPGQDDLLPGYSRVIHEFPQSRG